MGIFDSSGKNQISGKAAEAAHADAGPKALLCSISMKPGAWSIAARNPMLHMLSCGLAAERLSVCLLSLLAAIIAHCCSSQPL